MFVAFARLFLILCFSHLSLIKDSLLKRNTLYNCCITLIYGSGVYCLKAERIPLSTLLSPRTFALFSTATRIE